jgi:RND family efflux transporter MFP subunit
MRLRRGSLLVLIALVAAGGAGLAWWRWHPVFVDVVQPTRGTAIDAVYATGTVEPTVAVPIAPRVAGRLVSLKVDEGARVRKGQVLARLEDANLQRALDELDARARYARQALERAETLLQRGLGTAADRDKALADAKAADAAVGRSREELAFMVLVAPSNGLIMRRDGEVGQFIAVNQAIFQLATDAPLRITADVDEEDIAQVIVGQPVVIRADAFPEQVFDGEVAEVTPKGDPTTRSYRVRIRLLAATPLRVGMTTDANIIVQRHDRALLLPPSALVEGRVWVVRQGRLQRLDVRTGISGDKGVEIVAGLGEHDDVVALPLDSFRAGQAVQPRRRADAGAGVVPPAR